MKRGTLSKKFQHEEAKRLRPSRRAEANQFLEELEGLLLREAIEEPNESDLVSKTKPVMKTPALVELH
jgi:hypothetical protein